MSNSFQDKIIAFRDRVMNHLLQQVEDQQSLEFMDKRDLKDLVSTADMLAKLDKNATEEDMTIIAKELKTIVFNQEV